MASFIAETQYGDVPNEVIDLTKLHVLDACAAGLLGTQLPWSKTIERVSLRHAGTGSSSVFGRDAKTDALSAAMINGCMIGAFEVDDGGPNAHPGATTLPAALALGEQLEVSGAEFLLAIALGYEVVLRIGDAATSAVEIERGFHSPGTNGPFAGATAAGKLLGLDAVQQGRALGIAGSYSSGLAEFAVEGTLTKRMHLGKASRGGLEAALLAEEGFTGPLTVLEGKSGYLHAFSPCPAPERLLDELGKDWRIRVSTIKMHPGKGHSQGFVAAIKALKEQRVIDPEALTDIHVAATAELLQPRYLRADPTSELGAQYSLPFAIAAALCRDLDDPLGLADGILSDERVRRLAHKVRFSPTEGGEDCDGTRGMIGAHEATAWLELTDDTGTATIEFGAFRGSPTNPATFDEVAEKFRTFSRYTLDTAGQDTIIDLVSRVEELPNLSELSAALRGAQPEAHRTSIGFDITAIPRTQRKEDIHGGA